MAAALVTGCGSVGATHTSSSQEDAAVEAQLLTLYTTINGSVEQRRAFEAVNQRRAQDQLLTCMGDKGFTYPPAAFVDPYPGWTTLNLPGPRQEASDVSVERASTRGFGIANGILAQPAPPAAVNAYEGMTSEQRAGYDKALDGCGGDLDDSLSRGLPDFVYPVSDDLLNVMTEALDSAGIPRDDESRPAYEKCLAEAGFKAADREELETQASLKYAPYLTYEGAAKPGQTKGSEWDAAVAFEQSAAVADANCRAADHARYVHELAPLLDAFAADHAAAIQAVAAQWVTVQATADDLAKP